MVKNKILLTYIISRVFLSMVLMCLPLGVCKFAGFVLLEFCISFIIITAISNKRSKILALSAQFIISLMLYMAVFFFKASEPTVKTYEEAKIETDAQF